MTVVDLRAVTRENLRACLELDVLPEPRGFVSPNVRSLAEAYVLPEADPRMIYADDEAAGGDVKEKDISNLRPGGWGTG